MSYADRVAHQLYRRQPGFPWILASIILAPAGWLYAGLMRLRAEIYRRGWLTSTRSSCKVISVGNLTIGGTGKTPISIFLAQALAVQGRKVAVISRGYRGEMEGQTAVVSDGRRILLNASQAGDEAVLIARALPEIPVIIGARRPEAVELACQMLRPEVVICDDAFSHLALQRDCDVVLIHGRDGLGSGRCTPAGPLREPPSALRRATVIVLNCSAGEDTLTENEIRKSGYFGPVLRLRYGLPSWRRLRDGATIELSALSDRRVLAFAATARPSDIFQSFATAGLEVAESMAFPDHFRYPAPALRQLEQVAAARGICYLATTEKDAVKLPAAWPEGYEVLVAAVTVTGAPDNPGRLVELVEERCWGNRPFS